MKVRKRKKQWSKRVWVGYSDGRPAYTMIDTGFGGWGHGGYRTIVIFTDRARAKREYEDVRPMTLTLSTAEGQKWAR